jgi:hypothetical protein
MRSITIKRAAGVPVFVAVMAFANWSSPAFAAKEEGPPAAITGGAHAAGATVVLSGTVNPHKLATTYYFKYGPTTSYGSATAEVTIPAGRTEPDRVSQSVTGMLAGYHYRLVASNSDGHKEGLDHTYVPKTVKAKKPTPSKVKPAFVLPSAFQPTIYGGTFVLSGTLTGADDVGRAIVLEASPYPYRGVYTDVGTPIPTGLGGRFSFTVAHLKTSTRFRVATASGAPLYSDVLTQLAVERVTLKVRTSRSRGLVRLYGTVWPAAIGAHLAIQLEKAAKPKTPRAEKPEKASKLAAGEEAERAPKFATKFTTVIKRATRSLSRFSVVVKVTHAGNYRAYVELPLGPIAPGASQVIALKAGPKKR